MSRELGSQQLVVEAYRHKTTMTTTDVIEHPIGYATRKRRRSFRDCFHRNCEGRFDENSNLLFCDDAERNNPIRWTSHLRILSQSVAITTMVAVILNVLSSCPNQHDFRTGSKLVYMNNHSIKRNNIDNLFYDVTRGTYDFKKTYLKTAFSVLDFTTKQQRLQRRRLYPQQLSPKSMQQTTHHANFHRRHLHFENISDVVTHSNQSLINRSDFHNTTIFELLESRIVGGDLAPKGLYPWYGIPFGNELCGSSLIHSDILLTAAHCVGAFVQSGVLIGGIRIDGSDKLSFAEVDKEYPHYAYDPSTDLNDIMLIKLESQVTNIEPLSLNFDNNVPQQSNESVTVMGFGYTSENGTFSQLLRKTNIVTIDYQQCKPTFPDRLVNDSMICAGVEEGKYDACQGDSGSPLILQNNDNSSLQVGVVLFGLGCGRENTPAVYTRISHYQKWIQDGICILSASPFNETICKAVAGNFQPSSTTSPSYTTTSSASGTSNDPTSSLSKQSSDETSSPTFGSFFIPTISPTTTARLPIMAPTDSPTSQPIRDQTKKPTKRPQTSEPIMPTKSPTEEKKPISSSCPPESYPATPLPTPQQWPILQPQFSPPQPTPQPSMLRPILIPQPQFPPVLQRPTNVQSVFSPSIFVPIYIAPTDPTMNSINTFFSPQALYWMTFDSGQERIPGIFTRSDETTVSSGQQYWKWQHLFTNPIDKLSKTSVLQPKHHETSMLRSNGSNTSSQESNDLSLQESDLDGQFADFDQLLVVDNSNESNLDESTPMHQNVTPIILDTSKFHKFNKKMVMDYGNVEIHSNTDGESVQDESVKEIHIPDYRPRPLLRSINVNITANNTERPDSNQSI